MVHIQILPHKEEHVRTAMAAHRPANKNEGIDEAHGGGTMLMKPPNEVV